MGTKILDSPSSNLSTNLKKGQGKKNSNNLFTVVTIVSTVLVIRQIFFNRSNEKNQKIEISFPKQEEKSFSCNFSKLENSKPTYQFIETRDTKIQDIEHAINKLEKSIDLNDGKNVFANIIDCFEKHSYDYLCKPHSLNRTYSEKQAVSVPKEQLYIGKEIVFDSISNKVEIKEGLIKKTLALMKVYIDKKPIPEIFKLIIFLKIHINLIIIKNEGIVETKGFLQFSLTDFDIVPNVIVAVFEKLITLLRNDEKLDKESREAMTLIIDLLSKKFQIIINYVNYRSDSPTKLIEFLKNNRGSTFLQFEKFYLDDCLDSLDTLEEMIKLKGNFKFSFNKYYEQHQTQIGSLSLRIANLIYYFKTNKSNYSKRELEENRDTLAIIEDFIFFNDDQLKKSNGEYEIKFNDRLWDLYKDFFEQLYQRIFKDHKDQDSIKAYFFDNIFIEKDKNSELSINLVNYFDVVKKDNNQLEINFNLKTLRTLIKGLKECLYAINVK